MIENKMAHRAGCINVWLILLLVISSCTLSVLGISEYGDDDNSVPTDAKARFSVFADAGFGLGDTGALSFSFVGSLNMSIQKKIFTIRLIKMEGFEIEGVREIGLLYGLSLINRPKTLMSFSVGYSRVAFEEVPEKQYSGVPIELKIFTRMPKAFGLGLGIISYANFNKYKTFYGFNVCVEFIFLNKFK